MKIKNLLYNKKFRHNGNKYDLSHLQPLSLNMFINKKDVKMEVEFSTHTFTETYDVNTHKPDVLIEDCTNIDISRHHKRAFDIDRYNLSLELVNTFSKITPYTKTYYTSRGNFIVHNNDYYIFFRIYRKKNIAKLYVKSAYKRRNKLSGNLKNIKKCLMEKGF